MEKRGTVVTKSLLTSIIVVALVIVSILGYNVIISQDILVPDGGDGNDDFLVDGFIGDDIGGEDQYDDSDDEDILDIILGGGSSSSGGSGSSGSSSSGGPLDDPPSGGPVCGNGHLEGEEECDDGNTISGDGCSSDCEIEDPLIHSFTGLPLTWDGWTDFETLITNPDYYNDSRVIFVSSSEGDDERGAIYSIENLTFDQNGIFQSEGSVDSFKTIAAGYEHVRAGYPDIILLKRGDVWEDERFDTPKSGRSKIERHIISSYGDHVDRAILNTGYLTGVKDVGNTAYLIVSGIRFYADDWDTLVNLGKGFDILGEGRDQLYEDNVFERYDYSRIQGWNSSKVTEPWNETVIEPRVNSIAIRRSQFMETEPNNLTAKIYVQNTHDLLLEENIFYSPVEQNRHLYLSPANSNNTAGDDHTLKGLILRGNIFFESRRCGISARAAGLIENNLLLRNDLIIYGGHGGSEDSIQSGEVLDNVFLESTVDGPGDGEHGIYMKNIDGGNVSGNIWTDPEHLGPNNNYAMGVYGAENVNITKNLDVYDNIVYGRSVDGKGHGFFVSNEFQEVENVKIHDNDFQMVYGSYEIVRHRTSTGFDGFTYADNRYYSTRSEDEWFFQGNLSDWVETSGEIGAQAVEIEYPDPDRNLKTYNQMLGGASSTDDFMLEALNQKRGYWREEYTADAVNDYIREGFGVQDVTWENLIDRGEIHPIYSQEDGLRRGMSAREYKDILDGNAPGHAIGPDGWTQIVPLTDAANPEDNTRLIYVDPVNGVEIGEVYNVSDDGNYPDFIGDDPENPVNESQIVAFNTARQAHDNSRGGPDIGDGKPDWILVRRGTVVNDWFGRRQYSGGRWQRSGLDENNRFVITSYGDGERPIFDCNCTLFAIGGGGGSDSKYENVIVKDLNLRARMKDLTHPDFDLNFRFRGATQWTLRVVNWRWENIMFNGRSFLNQHDGGNVHFRRCAWKNVYDVSGGGHTLSTFAGDDGSTYWSEEGGALIYDECVFSGGGWNRNLTEFMAGDTLKTEMKREPHYTELNPDKDVGDWNTVVDGSFEFCLGYYDEDDCDWHQATGVDFHTAGDFDDIASIMEEAINTAVGDGNATVHYSTFDTAAGTHHVLVFTVAGSYSYFISAIRDYDGQPGRPIGNGDWLSKRIGDHGYEKLAQIPTDNIHERNIYVRSHPYTLVRGVIDDSSNSDLQLGYGNMYRTFVLRASHGGFSWGKDDLRSKINHNLFMYIRQPWAMSNRGWAWHYGDPGSGSEFIGNIAAHKDTDAGGREVWSLSLGDSGNPGDGKMEWDGNVAYNWGRGLVINNFMGGWLDFVLKNDIYHDTVFPGQYLFRVYNDSDVADVSFRDNVYYSELDDDGEEFWIYNGTSHVHGNFTWWESQVDDEGSTYGPAVISDPDRDVVSYLTSIGDPGTVDDFVERALANEKGSWNENYTSTAVINYIRGGYDMDPAPAGYLYEEIPGDNRPPIEELPNVTITYPVNTYRNGTNNYSYIVTYVEYEVIDDEGLEGCWYYDGYVLSSPTACTGIFEGLNSVEDVEDWNKWTVYAKDTAGNIRSDRVVFMVDLSGGAMPSPPMSPPEYQGEEESIIDKIFSSFGEGTGRVVDEGVIKPTLTGNAIGNGDRGLDGRDLFAMFITLLVLMIIIVLVILIRKRKKPMKKRK